MGKRKLNPKSKCKLKIQKIDKIDVGFTVDAWFRDDDATITFTYNDYGKLRRCFSHLLNTKSAIWCQIFLKNLTIVIAMKMSTIKIF